MEEYPNSWQHCMIHLNPETGEMHSDGDHHVREWIQDRLKCGTDQPNQGEIMPEIWIAFIEDYREHLVYLSLPVILKAFWYYEDNKAECEVILGIHS